jgi:phosphomannomutase
MSIKLSISGIRGQFQELSPNRVVEYVQAFSTYIGGGDVIVGYDSRPSGKFINEAVISGFMSGGTNVFDYGMLPTPILQWIIKHSSFQGGISITAGHNTFDWNSLIFLNSEGSYITHLEGVEFFNLYHSGNFTKQPYDKLGSYNQSRKLLDDYFRALFIEEKPGKQQKFVIDCANGFDCDIVQKLADALHIKVIPIFCGKESTMSRDPEPNIGNAGFLGTIVRETGSDGGFLLNSDASRVLVVDETGRPLSEELSLPIFADIMMGLGKADSDIVTNYSTSKTIDMVARKYGARVVRTEVGQPYVVQMVKNIKAEIGGEGSGSVIFSPFSMGFDSFVFIKYMVEFLRKHNIAVSDITRQFETPKIYKETISLPPNKIYRLLEKIGNLYRENEIIRLKDGFYIDYGEDWLCIRASATVSMIRIIGEGKRICNEIVRVKELVS